MLSETVIVSEHTRIKAELLASKILFIQNGKFFDTYMDWLP